MKRHIWLRDLEALATPAHDEYTPAEMGAARMTLAARGLRYDNATGVIRDNANGELERPSRAADHTPHADLEAVMRWEFRRYIANSASRVRRGFSA